MHFENLKILYAHGLWLTSYMKGRNKLTWNCWLTLAPGEMQLTYMAYTGISTAGKGIVFDLAVLNRVYNFVRVCQWGITCTIDLISYMNFIYTPLNYKQVMT